MLALLTRYARADMTYRVSHWCFWNIIHSTHCSGTSITSFRGGSLFAFTSATYLRHSDIFERIFHAVHLHFSLCFGCGNQTIWCVMLYFSKLFNYNTKNFSKLYFTVVLCGSIGTRRTTSAPPKGPVKMLQKIVGGTAATDGVCRFQFDYFRQKHLISSVCAHSNSHIR